jgi:PPM family protein phosphatase
LFTTGPIEQALTAINRDLYDEMDQKPTLRTMGATVAGVQVTPTSIEVFNVGDARVYQHIGGYTTLISIDDRSKTGNGEITQSLGGTSNRTSVTVHLRTISLDKPHRILLCTDGLSEFVSFSVIQETLDEQNPEVTVRRLVSLALAAGAPDNVTAVVLDVTPVSI